MYCITCGSTDFHVCNIPGAECIWITIEEDDNEVEN